MNCLDLLVVCAAADAGSSAPGSAPARAAAAAAHQLEAAHHAGQVVRLGQEVRVDARRRPSGRRWPAHAAAALRAQQAHMAGIAVAEHRLAAVVDQLADHEVQLQIGHAAPGWLLDEAAGLGEVGGQHAGALARHSKMPFTARRQAGQRQAEQVFQVRACRPPAPRPHGRAGCMPTPGRSCTTAMPCWLQVLARADARQHQQLRRQQRAGAQQHLARARSWRSSPSLAVLHAHGAPALEQDAGGMRAR
jgi:hypothetical protein